MPPFDSSWIEKPRPEAPQRAFTDISDGNVGLMIANRGLPEVEALHAANGATEIALTLLRCVGWLSRDDFPARKGHAGPAIPTPGAQMIGKWKFEYSIIPHSGDWQSAFRQAYAFNAPMRAVSTEIHSGVLPNAASFIQVDPAAFVISAVKAAEGSEGWIVRGYNITGSEIEVTLRTHFPFARATQTNLAEQAQAELAVGGDSTVKFRVRGYEVVTIRLG